MKPFSKINSIITPFDKANVDTDQIIPKQFLKLITKSGFGKFLFYDWRFNHDGKEKDDFILNDLHYQNSQILVTNENFGCGSSREHAPWALLDFGITCVISSSYADIFYNNCFKNGILPIILSEEKIKELSEYSKRQEEIEINLNDEKIIYGNNEISFKIEPFKKKCLLEGLDDIALSLEKSSNINEFEKKLESSKPWIFND